MVLLLWLVPIVAIGVFLVRPPSSDADTGAVPLTGTVAQAATTAARSSAQQILSYDYRHIAADIGQAQADATGVFAQQYAGTAKRLLSEAKQERTIVHATIGASGVVSAASTTVVVLVFVDQATVRQPAGQRTPTTRIDQSRVRMTMTLVHGRWLVSQLDAL